MGLLNRGDLLKKEPVKIERVFIDGTNHVFVRQMNGRERDKFEASLRGKTVTVDGHKEIEEKHEDFRAKLAVCTVCDEEGRNILKQTDYEALSQNMSAATLEIIINKAQELNFISGADKEALVKNSEAVRSGDSTSGSAKS